MQPRRLLRTLLALNTNGQAPAVFGPTSPAWQLYTVDVSFCVLIPSHRLPALSMRKRPFVPTLPYLSISNCLAPNNNEDLIPTTYSLGT
ncbi:hypothetical protein F5Y08DRAFT_168104 [Xylaria arbuscula]|nr:hypothetical protein F5Y08DRAFT_168104 [Xylaria arbuscula]